MAERNCDIDDLMCQIRMKAHLQGMKGLLGDDKFKEQYPEFQGLEQTVDERIASQETTIREAFENCGIPLIDQESVIEQPQHASAEENLEEVSSHDDDSA